MNDVSVYCTIFCNLIPTVNFLCTIENNRDALNIPDKFIIKHLSQHIKPDSSLENSIPNKSLVVLGSTWYKAHTSADLYFYKQPRKNLFNHLVIHLHPEFTSIH